MLNFNYMLIEILEIILKYGNMKLYEYVDLNYIQ